MSQKTHNNVIKKNDIVMNNFVSMILIAAFYAYQYIFRIMPNFIQSNLSAKFESVQEESFGFFLGIYYLGYALVHLPIGFLLDKYGFRKVCLVSGVITSFSSLLLLSNSWYLCLLSRLLTGVGSAGIGLVVMSAVSIYYKDKFSQIVGAIATLGVMGAMSGNLIKYLMIKIGFVNFVWLIVIIGLILTIIFFFVNDYTHNVISTKNLTLDILHLLKNTKILLLCMCGAFMIGTLEGFADGKCFYVLRDYMGFSENSSVFASSLIFFGMGVGCPLFGYINNKYKIATSLIFASGIFMCFAIFFFFLKVQNITIVSLILFLSGVASGYQVIAIEKISKYSPKRIFSLTVSYINMIFMGFGFVFHSICGKSSEILKLMGCSSESLPLLSSLPIAILSLIGAFGFLIIFYMDKTDN